MWILAARSTSATFGSALLSVFLGSYAAAGADGVQAPGQKAIEGYIEAHSQGGVFSIYDPRVKKALVLEPGLIHSTAHKMKSGEIFYCVDFKSPEGTPYDLDFYVDERGAKPVVVESLIHKADGADRVRPKEGADSVSEPVAAKVRSAITGAWAKPMVLYDKRLGRETTFTYENVHPGVKEVGAGNFYACVDARDDDNVLHDLDTYVRNTKEGYEIVEVLIHKRDGVERLR